jgi:FkbM family methyltransferase
MNKIDRVFLINLDKRQDRLIEFMQECRKMNIQNVERFSAIYRPDHPALGCTSSHLAVVKLAKEKRYKNIIIFEDDFTFDVSRDVLEQRLTHFFNQSIPFKVLMLTYSLYDTHPATRHDDIVSTISYAANAAAYLVNESCYDELIEHLSYGAEMLDKTRQHWNYINDQIWRRSMETGGWFIFNEKMGRQRDSYSDLRETFFCPDKTTYTSVYDGMTFYHTDNAFHESIQNGTCEPYPHDIEIVKKYLYLFPHKNRGYVDVGAHIGATIVPFMRSYKECVAYEPNPDLYPFLCKNVRHIEKILTKPLAVWNSSSKVTLHHGGYNSGCYYSKDSKDSKEDTSNTSQSIQTIRLDDDQDIANIPIDFIKIDTYGSDLKVLLGAIETIKRNRPLIQVHDHHDILQLLESMGAIPFDHSTSGKIYYYFPNETLCILPRTIFCFWTGATEMSENRKNCLSTIQNCRLITPDVLDKYILQSHPLHRAYQYLSEVHRADYLRTYFMHFYGGGYTDVKLQGGSWENSFREMENGEYDACGYKEIGPNGVGNHFLKDKWENLIGNGAYIFKPYTAFTTKWYNEMIRYLDQIYPILKDNPAQFARDCVEHNPSTTYPISWCRMLGYIFHPINYEFHQRVLQTLPQPLFYHYL